MCNHAVSLAFLFVITTTVAHAGSRVSITTHHKKLSNAFTLIQQATFTIHSRPSIGLSWFLFKQKDATFVTHSGGTRGYRSNIFINTAAANAVTILYNGSNNTGALSFSILKWLNK
jgi:hypothetical protein